jgi:hypothetical protein
VGNPSPGNYCHHCRVPTNPNSIHQETFCLTDAHLECPVYRIDDKKTFPHTLQGGGGRNKLRGSRKVRVFIIILVLGALLVFGWLYFQLFITGDIKLPGLAQESQTSTVIPSETKLQPTLALPTITIEVPTLSPVPTIILPTLTKIPPQRHALEVLVNVDNQNYLIHQAMVGDGFDYLAKTYKTSADVIRAMNYMLPPNIWENLPVVIAPGMTIADPSLPPLQAYKVLDQEISIDDLAKILLVDANLFRHYNACPDGCILVKGDWVIVPHNK